MTMIRSADNRSNIDQRTTAQNTISGQPLKTQSADNRSKYHQRTTAQNTIEKQQRAAAQYIAMKLMMKETADNRSNHNRKNING